MGTAVKRSPLLVFFATLFLTLPFTSNSSFYWFFYGVCLLVIFPIAAYFSTRQLKVSLVKQLKQHHPVLFYLLIAFAFSSLVSLCNVYLEPSNSLQHKIIASQRYINCWLLVFYVFMMARFNITESISPSNLFLLIAYGSLILTGLLLFSFTIEGAASAFYWLHYPPFGSHMRIIGMMLEIAIIVVVMLLLFTQVNKHKKLFYLAIFFICNTFLFWSGGRMSILASIACLTFFTYLAWQCKRVNGRQIAKFLVLFCSSIIAAEMLSIYSWNGLARIGGVAEIALQQDDSLAMLSQFGRGRIAVWTTAIQGFLQAPLFGLGPHAYLFLDRPAWEDHTHNFIIEFLLEWGVIGASLLVAALLYIAIQGLKRLPMAIENSDIDWLICAALALALTINGLADGVYFILLPCFIALTTYTRFPFFSKKQLSYLQGHYLVDKS